MPTRYKTGSKARFGVPPLPTGYDNDGSPTNLTIPSVGFDDCDRALFSLFEREINFQVGGDGSDTKKVPIIFATGEKWALNKRQRALRDRNNTLVLPLITVVRTSIQQSMTDDITGRGTNQQTGEITIQRRLDPSDRSYQGLINRLFLEHQQGLAVGPNNGPDNGQLTTSRPIGDLRYDPTVEDGGLLAADRLDNVYETLVIPAPQFYTAFYDVTLWAQHHTHMNQMLEQVMSSFLPQGNAWKLDTPKGYWFVAYVVDGNFTADNNVDDMSQSERIVKHKFSVRVPAYVLASSASGVPIPIKRYVSVPSVSFDMGVVAEQGSLGDVEDPFLGADDPTLPLGDGSSSRRTDQRDVNATRLFPGSLANPDDPAQARLPRGTAPGRYKKVIGSDASGKQVTRYVRVVNVNRFTGETVLAPDAVLGGLTIETSED